jgi:hypothetical protein
MYRDNVYLGTQKNCDSVFMCIWAPGNCLKNMCFTIFCVRAYTYTCVEMSRMRTSKRVDSAGGGRVHVGERGHLQADC